MFSYLKDLIVGNNIEQFKLSFKASEHATLNQGGTLLHWACAYGRSELTKILLEAGLSPTIQDATKKTSLQYAFENKHFSTLKVILQFAITKRDHDLVLSIVNDHPQLLVDLADNQRQFPVDSLFQGFQALFSEIPLEINWNAQRKRYCIAKVSEPNVATLTAGIGNLGVQDKPTYRRVLASNNACFLLRRYFDLKLRISKYSRDFLLGAHTPHNHERYLAELDNQRLLRLALGFCLPPCNEGAKIIAYHEVFEQTLESYLKQQQTQSLQYFSDDLSDDSDNEDDIAITQPSTKKKIQKLQIDRGLIARGGANFWIKTGRNKPGNAKKKRNVNSGLAGRLADIAAEHRAGKMSEKMIIDTLNGVPKRGNTQKKKSSLKVLIFDTQLALRGTIIPLNQQALDDISKLNNLIIRDGGFKIEHLLGVATSFIFAKYRGLNYMEDRWNETARRYHRLMEEENIPQYAEMILRCLPFCFYTELSAETDYTKKPELIQQLIAQALKVQEFFYTLEKSGACVDVTDLRGGSEYYAFENIVERMQHHFSNGIDELLKNLQTLRTQYPHYWGHHLPNGLNPFNATGDRPLHTLKYALGLKDYYSYPLQPHYNVHPDTKEVVLEHSHVGKVYASLHSIDEVLGEKAVYNVSMMDKEGRVQIRQLIAPEKETNFPVFISANSVDQEYVVKFPSFTSVWKPIHEIKYGLDSSLYNSFKYLIQISAPHTELRAAVVQLLADWLCSFHESRLIDVMFNRAHIQNKQLVYLTRDGTLSLTPDAGQLMQGYEDNTSVRNEVHIKRTVRKSTAQTLKMSPADTTSYPGFTVYPKDQAQTVVRGLLEPPMRTQFISSAAKDVDLTKEQDDHRKINQIASELPYKEVTIQETVRYVIQRGIFQPLRNSSFTRSPVPQQEVTQDRNVPNIGK